MHIYCKTCNKHTANTFPKRITLISNKIKSNKNQGVLFALLKSLLLMILNMI